MTKALVIKKFLKLKKIKIYELSYLSKLRPSDKFLDFKNINKNDISCIFFTSGSSGKPKGVELTYQNVISCAIHQIKNLNYKNNQIFADCHDTGFVMSLVVISYCYFKWNFFSSNIFKRQIESYRIFCRK